MSSTPARRMSITDAAGAIRANPVPVLIVDTCNYLDLVRVGKDGKGPYANAGEIAAAVELHTAAEHPARLHLFVPEFVPGEWQDHADRHKDEVTVWARVLDEQLAWLQGVAGPLGKSPPPLPSVAGLDLAVGLRAVSEQLLNAATVLDRDMTCVGRALDRLASKRPPSSQNQIKDSIHLEQCLELTRQVRTGGCNAPVVWVSSNKSDFGGMELRAEFGNVGLEYKQTLQAAAGKLLTGRAQPSS